MKQITLSELCVIANDLSERKGFWPDPKPSMDHIGLKLALIHTEVSEAVECLRDSDLAPRLEGDKPCGLPSELADAVIRIADLCGKLGIDLNSAVAQKLSYNETRPHKHGRGA